jgi:hypothetical protein
MVDQYKDCVFRAKQLDRFIDRLMASGQGMGS